MAVASRTRLGTYDILGPLGSGGMGEVYRATDTRLRRDVAPDGRFLMGKTPPEREPRRVNAVLSGFEDLQRLVRAR